MGGLERFLSELRLGQRRRMACTLGMLLVLASLLRAAEAANSTQTATPDPTPQLQSRLAEARGEVGRYFAQGGTTNPPAGVGAAEWVEYGLTLESMARVYQKHLEELNALEIAREARQDLEDTAKAWTGFAEPPPHSILLEDDLRDSLQSLTAKIAAGETTQTVLQKVIQEARAALQASDTTLRMLVEQLEAAKNVSESSGLGRQRTLEQARNRLALATVGLNETRLRRVEAELAERRQRLAFLRRQLASLTGQVRFSQADLDRVLSRLDAERRELEAELRDAESESDARQRALAAGREELRRLLQTSADADVSSPDPKARVREVERLNELRVAQADTAARRVSELGQLLDFALAERGLWGMRFATFRTEDLPTLQAAYARLERISSLIATAKPHFVQQIEVAANLMAEQRTRIQNQALTEAEAARQRELLGLYQQRDEIARRALRGTEKLERLVARWRQSLDLERASLPLTGRVRDLFSSFSGFAAKFWNFELFAAEDTITVDGQTITGRRGVTVAKIVGAILILAVGYGIALGLSRLLERLAVSRLKVEANQANLIRRWTRVVMVIAVVVFSLVSVKIPLTVFAFLGGALAIGLGFGTQTLLKNFISGIIILFERPFRVGDVLDVGGQRGTVVSIGIRSSVLKLWDNTETLIPNSTLLEHNLTNWTYSDRKVRFSVEVGVAFGSDTRRVARLLAEVAERHGLVQKDPPPQVLFQAFGDNALTFELRYWVDVVKQNAAQIGSDLRHMIAGEFAQHGIGIAFPQRDVHVDTIRPLQVQMVSTDKTEATQGGDDRPGIQLDGK